MNVKNISSKKALKFLGLLISAMLIATVSAVTYRYMYIDGSITVGSPRMIWILGDDAPSDASISGSTAIMDFDVENGTPATFENVLFLKNEDDTNTYAYNLTITTPLLTTDFNIANMHIYENTTVPGTWTFLDTMTLTDSADFYYSASLGTNNYLEMRFEVNATATIGTFNFDIQAEYW
jgi:hypothetical protein